jgi:hypothetical protein
MVEIVIDYARARERHPEVVAAMMQSFETKLRRAKLPAPSPHEVTWLYDYASGPKGGQRGPLAGLYVSLVAKLGKRYESHPFHEPRKPTALHLVPEEIITQRTERFDPRRIPHICEFEMINMGGVKESHLAVGGYERPDGRIRILEIDFKRASKRDIECPGLLTMADGHVLWAGGLSDTAQQRFDATEEGGEFTFNRQTYRKLTAQEVRDHVENKVLRMDAIDGGYMRNPT